MIGKPIFRDRTRLTHQVRPRPDGVSTPAHMAADAAPCSPAHTPALEQREPHRGFDHSVGDRRVQHTGCRSGCFVVDTVTWNDTVSANFSKIFGATHLRTATGGVFHAGFCKTEVTCASRASECARLGAGGRCGGG